MFAQTLTSKMLRKQERKDHDDLNDKIDKKAQEAETKRQQGEETLRKQERSYPSAQTRPGIQPAPDHCDNQA